MANLVEARHWAGRRVFLTGHTGFKGAWLCLLLHRLGARVTGYALDPPTTPALFSVSCVAETLASDTRADILEHKRLRESLVAATPELVIHLAAQPLVRASYADPISTYASNVMGTVHILDAVRHAPTVRAVLVITTDKCYENREWAWGYRENDRLGGHDPYSSSKAAAELVTQSFRDSFFSADRVVAVATARAGNAIGGGDWAPDRIIPDAVRAMAQGCSLEIRYPDSTRPWQHVLDPLGGYLCLAEHLLQDGAAFAEGWNFGPDAGCEHSVAELLSALEAHWGSRLAWRRMAGVQPHEAGSLTLDCAKARRRLGWRPQIGFSEAVAWTASWYDSFERGRDLQAFTLRQVDDFLNAASSRN